MNPDTELKSAAVVSIRLELVLLTFTWIKDIFCIFLPTKRYYDSDYDTICRNF